MIYWLQEEVLQIIKLFFGISKINQTQQKKSFKAKVKLQVYNGENNTMI